MKLTSSTPRKDQAEVLVVLFSKGTKTAPAGLSKSEWAFVQTAFHSGQDSVLFSDERTLRFLVPLDEKSLDAKGIEGIRMKGAEIQAQANKRGNKSLLVVNESGWGKATLAIAEGIVLGGYQFLKYFSDRKKKKNSLENLFVQDASLTDRDLEELYIITRAVGLARDLVNEPHSYLTATQFAKEMEKAGKEAGFRTKILGKKEIERLKMGGLLGVNRGSMDPPTFTVMEYKPSNPRNKKPLVLVGKGVVFDTGGLSLKPTPGSMDEMKCDMSGAATVVGLMYAVALTGLPVHVVGLVPATDNRPGMNAIVPQDVITISDGTTVEVLNTDAEGRLILADALVYAKNYNPDLVIDLATLTGAAVRSVGSFATAVMGSASDEVIRSLEECGMDTWERMIRFPLWQDYGDEMKSEIADLKNLGGGNAGHISAGKFLEHFTHYPWIHMDIAGPAYSNSAQGYRTRGGSGVGIRSIYRFIKKHYKV